MFEICAYLTKMNVTFTSEVNQVNFPDLDIQLQTPSVTNNPDCVQGTSYPEDVSPPLEHPVNIFGQIAHHGSVISEDWSLGLACLAILWLFSLVGLFASRFPIGGKVLGWMLFSATGFVLVWTIVKWWRARRRNQGYISM